MAKPISSKNHAPDIDLTVSDGACFARAYKIARRIVRGELIENHLALQLHQLGDRVAPSLRAAAPVGGLAVSDLRRSVRMGCPKSCLPLRGR